MTFVVFQCLPTPSQTSTIARALVFLCTPHGHSGFTRQLKAPQQQNIKLISRKFYTVATVQGFWSVFNHIPCFSQLPSGSYYHLMREERPPLWEDPHIMNGGTWRMKCRKGDTVRVWKELLLASIGEQFEDSLAKGDDICGLSVSPRDRDDIIQIWNYDANLAVKGQVTAKVHSLVPEVQFLAELYKPHQTHVAYEGKRTQGLETTAYNHSGQPGHAAHGLHVTIRHVRDTCLWM